MIEVGNTVEVVRGSWWRYTAAPFKLLGLRGVVIDSKFGIEGRMVLVQFEEHGDIALFREEVEVIQ